MKKKSQFILVILLTSITALLLLSGIHKDKETKNKFAELAAEQEKINLIEQSIHKEFPGIIAWGDSLTVGTGGEGTNYTDELQKLIKTNVYNIPVINMGVSGETTHQIMGRAGSVPFIVDSFTIPKDTSKVEISIKLSNGNTANILRQGDKGVNPVTINGTMGIVTIEQESNLSQEYTYYFNRTESGAPVNVEDGTIMTTAASTLVDYQNYIPIVFMGQNGGWSDPAELISQIKSILNMDKWNDKFLVLGLTSGTAKSKAQLESAMHAEFGDRYINLRETIVKNGLVQLGLNPTEADVNAMNEGAIPPSLLSDTIHFNAYGYTVIGQIIYDRMIKLGYFDTIIELIEERDSI